MLNEALRATRDLLTTHRPALDDLVVALLEHETLEKDDLAQHLRKVSTPHVVVASSAPAAIVGGEQTGARDFPAGPTIR